MGLTTWSASRLHLFLGFLLILLLHFATNEVSSAPTVDPLPTVTGDLLTTATDSATTDGPATTDPPFSIEVTDATTEELNQRDAWQDTSSTIAPSNDENSTAGTITSTDEITSSDQADHDPSNQTVATESSSTPAAEIDRSDLSALESKNTIGGATYYFPADSQSPLSRVPEVKSPNAVAGGQEISNDLFPPVSQPASASTTTTTVTSYPVSWRPARRTSTRRPAPSVSGTDWFANTPAESLINATIVTRDDLTTLATLVELRTTTTTLAPPNDQNHFFYDRYSPGSTCYYKGRVYAAGQSLDQDDPCHFCVCVNGFVDCYWKNCPPAPEGCVELDYEGVCARSLYLCSIPKKGEPLPFALTRKKRQDISYSSMTCDILGVVYKVGELVGVASDPCMECRCAMDSLYCSPKCCFNPSEVATDPAKNSRANDVTMIQWQPVLSHPLKHLRYDFQNL